MTENDLSTQMKARIRRHLLVSFGGILLAFVGVVVSGGLFGKDPGTKLLLTIGVIGSIAIIPIVGLWSTFANLRCPACDGAVAWQVSANAAPFGNQASKKCAHCQKPIFEGRNPRFIRNLAILAVTIGVVASIVNMFLHR